MSRYFICVALLAAAALVTVAQGATFRIVDTQPTCFVEDISYGSDTVAGRFERKRNTATDHVPVKFVVATPKKEIPLVQTTAKPGMNTFSFKPIPEDGLGFHTICFTVEQWGWKSVHDSDFIQISIEVDHHDRFTILPRAAPEVTRQKVHKTDEVFMFTDFDGQQKETLRTHDYIERVNKLLTQISVVSEEVAQEVKHFEERTGRMRLTTESTFTRVWVLAVATMVAMVAVSWVQFAFLKSFLKRKKLV
jgi:hypothetical protein